MFDITNVRVYGLDESIVRSKYPMSVDVSKLNSEITNMTRNLGSCRTGEGHDNFLNGIVVQFDVNASIKWWTEAERYHFLDFVSSQSTMHRIGRFKINKQCNEYVSPIVINAVELKQREYEMNPTPENYLKLLYNTPVGFELTAGMTTNYRQLKTIHQQRKDHRLPEWKTFCKWIETLPKFKELCLGGES